MKTSRQAAFGTPVLVKWLALAGILGSVFFLLSGLWEMISPINSAVGSPILNPTQFQIGGLMRILAYLGWLAIAFALYLRGAIGSGWFAKITLALMTLGVVAMVMDGVSRILAVQNLQTAPWQIVLFFSGIFIAPILLGVAALRARVLSSWMALYPIVMVALLPFGLWTAGSVVGIGADLIILLQGLAWLGLAAIAFAAGKPVATVPAPSPMPA